VFCFFARFQSIKPIILHALIALLIVGGYLQAVKTELLQLQEQSQDEDMSQQLEMAELKAAAAAAEADASFERERRVRR
jgi:hypothetical protein